SGVLPQERPGSLSAKNVEQYLIEKARHLASDLKRKINPVANLMDTGLNSTELVVMTEEIGRDLAIDLLPTVLFEYPSIRELGQYLLEEYSRELGNLLADTPEVVSENVSIENVHLASSIHL